MLDIVCGEDDADDEDPNDGAPYLVRQIWRIRNTTPGMWNTPFLVRCWGTNTLKSSIYHMVDFYPGLGR